jgi:hypothetical protein
LAIIFDLKIAIRIAHELEDLGAEELSVAPAPTRVAYLPFMR